MLSSKKIMLFLVAIALVNASPTPRMSGCECTGNKCKGPRCKEYGLAGKQNILMQGL